MKSDEFPKVDISFPEETIVHALLAEEHLGCAHDSLVEYGCDENNAFMAFKDSIWARRKHQKSMKQNKVVIQRIKYLMHFT